MPTRQSPSLVQPVFTPLRGGRNGVHGPYGEVQVFQISGEWLPVRVVTQDRSASADFTGRVPVVRYGKGPTAITLSSKGISFADASPVPWNTSAIKRMIGALTTDAALTRSVMLLRSTLHTSYPVAVARQKEAAVGGRMSSLMKNASSALGQRAMFCTASESIETVTRQVTKLIETIATAEQQFQRCYDRQVGQPPCNAFPPTAGLCAAGICAAEAFVDIVTGFIEVVETITDQVVRQVLVCVPVRLEGYVSPWGVIPSTDLLRGVAQPTSALTSKQISEAAKLVKSFADFLGPFGTCLIEGRWSLAQLEVPLNLGGGPLVLPYGVKVCIRTECAENLKIENMPDETLASWGAALSALAALSPAFAAVTLIPAAPAVVAAVAALPPAVVAAAAIILGFIVLALIYATLIAAQLSLHGVFAGTFDDGLVCIEHPSFALGLLKLASLTLIPSELVPPIVTG